MTTGLRETVLSIVNRVERKLGMNVSATLTATSMSRVLLDMLNEVMDEISDSGDWQEMIQEVTVASQSSVGAYEVAVSGLVKRIHEISWNNDVAPLYPVDIADIRLFQRTNTYGSPRQFAIFGVNASSGNPLFRVHPVPTTAAAFSCLVFVKPSLYTTSSGSSIVPFPSNVAVQGLYAKALLFENGGERTAEFQTAYVEYQRMKKEAMARFNSDTGNDVSFVPSRR